MRTIFGVIFLVSLSASAINLKGREQSNNIDDRRGEPVDMEIVKFYGFNYREITEAMGAAKKRAEQLSEPKAAALIAKCTKGSLAQEYKTLFKPEVEDTTLFSTDTEVLLSYVYFPAQHPGPDPFTMTCPDLVKHQQFLKSRYDKISARSLQFANIGVTGRKFATLQCSEPGWDELKVAILGLESTTAIIGGILGRYRGTHERLLSVAANEAQHRGCLDKDTSNDLPPTIEK